MYPPLLTAMNMQKAGSEAGKTVVTGLLLGQIYKSGWPSALSAERIAAPKPIQKACVRDTRLQDAQRVMWRKR